MRVLAIDPGPEQSAFVVINTDGHVIEKTGIVDNGAFPTDLSVSCVVCEFIEGYGLSVGRTVFDTCFWVGRFCQCYLLRGIPFHRIGRKKVKTHLCNNNSARDSHVREALMYKFGGQQSVKKGGKLYKFKSHLWAALAVAVTFIEHEDFESITG